MNLLALMLLTLCDLGSAEPATLEVQVSVSDRVYFVGQGIEIRVGVLAEGTRPRLSAPRVGAAVPELIREEFRQLTTSGIGTQVTEQNLYISRFRIVPRSPGVLTIPPFRATLGDRSGASKPLSLTVKPLPPGRPSGFLGGVGKLAIKAEAVPASVRVGQEFEWRLTLTGPGARGSLEAPDLSSLKQLPIQPKVEELPAESVDDPPRRVLRYRLRPLQAGEVRIPAVAVAWLDPASERYMTVKSDSVPIRVSAVSEFDASKLSPAAEPSDARRPDSRGLWLGAVAAALLVAGLLLRRKLRERRARPKDGGSLVELLGEVRSASDADLPATICRGLWRWMNAQDEELTEGEPTPADLSARLSEQITNGVVKDEVVRMAEACDRARFSGRSVDLTGLRALAEKSLAALQNEQARPRSLAEKKIRGE